MEKISAIICTYNPNREIFIQCLDAITAALKNDNVLEIIIVDNNSKEKLEDLDYVKSFLSQHSHAKVVVEQKQGLTPARLRGIEEATGDILVYIDDDNIIAPDFFSNGRKIAAANPNIGSWSGQVHLRFEKEPEPWTRKYWGLLVYREFEKDCWSNLPHLEATMPCGAGLFVRKQVADYYHTLHHSGKRNIQLDRTGRSLFSGGDNDMAACACDIGLGVGIFHEIVVMHCIPAFRTEKEYLLKLAEGIAASTVVLKSFRGEFPRALTLKNRVANYLRRTMKKGTDREFYEAVLRGEATGKNMLQ